MTSFSLSLLLHHFYRKIINTISIFFLLFLSLSAQAAIDSWELMSLEGMTNISDIIVDPGDDQTVYIVGGNVVYKSTNGGSQWSLKSEGLDGYIASLKIDPANSQLLYAVAPFAIYKSIDGGENWSLSKQDSTEFYPQQLVIDPNTPATLYTSDFSRGLFKSYDEGANWTAINGDIDLETVFFTALSVAAANSQILYAGALDGSIYRTLNGGNSWELINNTSLTSMFNLYVDPANVQIVYASTYFGLYRSINSGIDWTQLLPGKVTDLEFDLSDTSKLFITTETEAYHSTDSGNNWQSIKTGNFASIATPEISSGTIYLGAQGKNSGILKSIDSANNWTQENTGLISPEIRGLDIDKSNPSTLIASDDYGRIFRTNDAGNNWAPISTLDEVSTFNSLIIDPQDSNVIYAAALVGGIFKSFDGGYNWLNVSATGIPKLSMSSSGALYAMEWDRISKSIDGIQNWHSIINIPVASGGFQDFEVEPGNDAVIYASLLEIIDNVTTFRVYKTENSGASWVAAESGLVLSEMPIIDFAIDTKNTSIVYATTGYEIFKSVNAGSSWQVLNAGHDESFGGFSIVIDPNNSNIIYFGNFKSENAGQTWSQLNGVVHNGLLDKFIIDPTDSSKLYIGTGTGAYKYTVGETSINPGILFLLL